MLEKLDLGTEIKDHDVFKQGGPLEVERLTVDPTALTSHMAVVASSGSGKSSFLARLVEELVLKTSARCIILDANSDFSLFHSVNEQTETLATADPPDAAAKAFKEYWNSRVTKERNKISLKTAVRGVKESQAPYAPIGLAWPLVSMDLLVDELSPSLAGQLYELHNAVRSFCEFKSLQMKGAGVPFKGLVDQILGFISAMKSPPKSGSKAQGDSGWRSVLPADAVPDDKMTREIAAALVREGATDLEVSSMAAYLHDRFIYHAEAIARAADISAAVMRFYRGKIASLSLDGIIADEVRSRLVNPTRQSRFVEAIDLASLRDRQTRFLVAGARIETEWVRALQLRESALGAQSVKDNEELRTPTFIIVDEAHNLLPNESHPERAAREVREQCRRIVAEGRKYSMHLILVTQRPQKVDPFILSECGNLLLMRCDGNDIASAAALSRLKDENLEDCENFDKGVGRMFGTWAGKARKVKFDLPRTRLASPDLPAAAWAPKDSD